MMSLPRPNSQEHNPHNGFVFVGGRRTFYGAEQDTATLPNEQGLRQDKIQQPLLTVSCELTLNREYLYEY